VSETFEQHGLAGQVTAAFRRRRIWPGLRMTPMIDVIFLLLTFFVLTVQFEQPEQALPLVFGASAAQPAVEPKAMEFTIAPHEKGCAVTLGENEVIIIPHASPAVGLAQLAAHVRQTAAAQQHQHAPIRLHCDDAVTWDLVTKIYDLLYGLGARDITFVVKD